MCLAAICWARIGRVYFAASREDAVSAGFDDLRILREITLPPEARSLRTFQDLREEGRAAFRAWTDKPDRIEY
jgi:tRNA(Arg) A34 adenosine deaminase TadA